MGCAGGACHVLDQGCVWFVKYQGHVLDGMSLFHREILVRNSVLVFNVSCLVWVSVLVVVVRISVLV